MNKKKKKILQNERCSQLRKYDYRDQKNYGRVNNSSTHQKIGFVTINSLRSYKQNLNYNNYTFVHSEQPIYVIVIRFMRNTHTFIYENQSKKNKKKKQ